MSVRNDIRKLIAALPEGAEFDYELAAGLKSGGQALVDLKDNGEIILVRREKREGTRTRNIYVARRKPGVMQMPSAGMRFLLGGPATAAKPKGTVTVHRIQG